MSNGRLPQDPSPEEIEQRCIEIQATWTEAQRRSRSKHAARDGGKFMILPDDRIEITEISLADIIPGVKLSKGGS